MKDSRNKPVLAILAAGLGSRYGGLKQIDPIGPNGELIIDYSVYDAYKAGFRKVVFLIKKEMQEIFEETIGARARNLMEVQYVCQYIDDIPKGLKVPEGRIKPWGTGHAVYALRHAVDNPFGVINADDFYGRESFQKLFDFLVLAEDKDKYDYCMVGYELKNTLTENGSVSRGICEISGDGKLISVTERTKIQRAGQAVFYEEDGVRFEVPADSVASINVWGFTPSLFKELERGFCGFMTDDSKDPLKKEYFLPFAVDELIKKGKADVKVMRTREKWYGVTYKEDKERVLKALRQLEDDGIYLKLK